MNNCWIADFHTHTAHSFDSEAPMKQMICAAQDHGLSAIAITDHVDMTMFDAAMQATADNSFAEAKALRAQFEGSLRVACGVELGEALDAAEDSERLLATHDYDFVLCSLHNLSDGLDYAFYDFSKVDCNELLDVYFTELQKLAHWGKFSSLSHLTYPVRYMPPAERPQRYSRWQHVLDDIFDTLIANEKSIELNTSGLRKGVGTTSPELPLLERYYERGGRMLTIGSDAHNPDDVGADTLTAAMMAKKIGFREACIYFGGNAEFLPLP